MSSPLAASAVAATAPAMVSTKSGDPIAQAALMALASLEGLTSATPVVTGPESQTAALSASAYFAVAEAPAAPPAPTVPPTTAVVWTDSGQGWKSVIIDTDAAEQTLNPDQPATTVPSTTAAAKKTKKSKATATAPGTTTPGAVRMLPASTVPGATGDATPVVAVADTSITVLAPDDARLHLAELVVARAKLDPAMVATLDSAWAGAEVRRQKAVFSALAQVGTPYRYSGNEPGGFDCSGLTSFAWAAAGVRLPRISTDQINAASPRTTETLLPGDLIWRPGHIMMYVGIGQLVVDSPQTGKLAQVRDWGRVSRMGSPI